MNNEIKEITPIIESETKNNKSFLGGNIFFFLMIIVIICFILFSDKIVNFITNNENNIVNKNNNSNNNLINGFIKINDKDNYMISNNIKFYNFRSVNGDIIINVMPYSDIKDAGKLNIYFEFYNSNEEMIDVWKFNESYLESNLVSNYNINVSSYVYKNAYYAKVNTYNKVDNKTLICSINDNNFNYKYEIELYFDFFFLKKYKVNKSLTYSEDNKYINDIKSDYEKLNSFNITNEYSESENKYELVYEIDFSNSEYNALFNINDNYFDIKSSLEGKEFICNE